MFNLISVFFKFDIKMHFKNIQYLHVSPIRSYKRDMSSYKYKYFIKEKGMRKKVRKTRLCKTGDNIKGKTKNPTHTHTTPTMSNNATK